MLPIDVKVNVKPVFAQLLHRGSYEGPCRVGAADDLTPEAERRRGQAQFEAFVRDLHKNVCSDARLLDPVYLEWHDDLVLSGTELAELESDAHHVDLFLMGPGGLDQYPAVNIAHRYRKPVGRMGWVGSVDIAAYLRAQGLEGYAFLNWEELNRVLTLLKVRKAFSNTRILVATEGNPLVPSGVVSSISDLEGLKRRYGVDYACVSAGDIVRGMEELGQSGLEQAQALTDKLIENAQRVHMDREDVLASASFYVAVRNALDKYRCNAFVIPCFELCVKRVPEERRVTFCLTHSLLKDEGIPSACEADINVLMAIGLLTYLSKKSVYMGNSYAVDGSENTLAVHHDVPGLKMKGLAAPDLPYEIRNFTVAGWGATIRYDFSRDAGTPVTLARFDPTGTRLLALRGELAGCGGFDRVGCSLSAHIKVRDVVDVFHKELDFGHHLAVVYGDYLEELRGLSRIMGFDLVES